MHAPVAPTTPDSHSVLIPDILFFFLFFFFFGKRFIHVVSYVPLSIRNNCKVVGDSQDQPYRTHCSRSVRPGGEMPLCMPPLGAVWDSGHVPMGPQHAMPPYPLKPHDW